MNNCPRCEEQMHIVENYTCEDADDCTCGEGLISKWICSIPECNTLVTIKTDCKGDE